MGHRASAAFWQRFHSLPVDVQATARKQFALLKVNPSYPSLQFKRLGGYGSRELWCARVTLNYRALAVRRTDGYLWFWIGDHKEYDQLVG